MTYSFESRKYVFRYICMKNPQHSKCVLLAPAAKKLKLPDSVQNFSNIDI